MLQSSTKEQGILIKGDAFIIKKGDDYMIGAIGAILFGAVFAGSWMVAENREQNVRKNGGKYYFDKNRRLRHADTGKKYTTDDALKAIYEARRIKEKEEEKRSLQYWGFYRYNICEVDSIYGKEMIFDCINKPVLELYNDYDSFKTAYDEIKEYYCNNNIPLYKIHQFCDGVNGNNKFSKDNLVIIRNIHYNF